MERSIEFDQNVCVGCYACVIACKMEYGLQREVTGFLPGMGGSVSRIRIEAVGPELRDDEVHYYFQPVACRHCAEAPCIDNCPESAISRHMETGITLVDTDKCTGCEVCLEVCPYRAPIFYNEKAVLCDLCFGRVEDQGGDSRKKTACEAACPAGAIMVR